MKRWLWALAVAIPLALFVMARNAASWRPQLMAADSPQALRLNLENTESQFSRSERWFALAPIPPGNNAPALLIDTANPSVKRKIGRGMPIFSRDEKLLALITPSYMGYNSYQPGKLPVRVEVSVYKVKNGRVTQFQPFTYGSKSVQGRGIQDGAFSPDNRIFTAVSPTAILRWDVASGKLISHIEGALFDFNPDFEAVNLFDGGSKVWNSGGYDDYSILPARIYDTRTTKRDRVYKRDGVLLEDERFYWGVKDQKIYRVSDDKEVYALTESRFNFSENGRLLLLSRNVSEYVEEFELVEVGTWRTLAHRTIKGVYDWKFDGPNHVLTRSNMGTIYRWRLR